MGYLRCNLLSIMQLIWIKRIGLKGKKFLLEKRALGLDARTMVQGIFNLMERLRRRVGRTKSTIIRDRLLKYIVKRVPYAERYKEKKYELFKITGNNLPEFHRNVMDRRGKPKKNWNNRIKGLLNMNYS